MVDLAGLDLWLDSVILKVLSNLNDSIIKGKDDKQVIEVHHEDDHLKDLSGRYYLDNRFMLLITETLWSLCSSLKREEGKGENTMLELLPATVHTVRSRKYLAAKAVAKHTLALHIYHTCKFAVDIFGEGDDAF